MFAVAATVAMTADPAFAETIVMPAGAMTAGAGAVAVQEMPNVGVAVPGLAFLLQDA